MPRFKVLGQSEYERDAKPRFDQIFRLQPPHGYLFTENVVSRGILYPTNLVLSPEQLDALLAAILVHAEKGLYLTILERFQDSDFDSHWVIPLDSVDRYLEADAPYCVLENALFSSKGIWGLRLDPDGYGIVGGSPQFIDIFYDNLSNSSEEQARRFLLESDILINRDERYISLLSELILHIFGQETGKHLLRRFGIL